LFHVGLLLVSALANPAVSCVGLHAGDTVRVFVVDHDQPVRGVLAKCDATGVALDLNAHAIAIVPSFALASVAFESSDAALAVPVADGIDARIATALDGVWVHAQRKSGPDVDGVVDHAGAKGLRVGGVNVYANDVIAIAVAPEQVRPPPSTQSLVVGGGTALATGLVALVATPAALLFFYAYAAAPVSPLFDVMVPIVAAVGGIGLPLATAPITAGLLDDDAPFIAAGLTGVAAAAGYAVVGIVGSVVGYNIDVSLNPNTFFRGFNGVIIGFGVGGAVGATAAAGITAGVVDELVR
jgi:hypothetical protein